jgi:hypothetical protein
MVWKGGAYRRHIAAQVEQLGARTGMRIVGTIKVTAEYH